MNEFDNPSESQSEDQFDSQIENVEQEVHYQQPLQPLQRMQYNGVQQPNFQQNNQQQQGYQQQNYQQPNFQQNNQQQQNYQQQPPNFQGQQPNFQGQYQGQYQPQPPNFQGQYQPPIAPSDPKKGFAITSMVLGIISTLFGCFFYISCPMGILAIIFGVIGRKSNAKGMAKAGIITASIGIFLGLLMIVLIALDVAESSYTYNF